MHTGNMQNVDKLYAVRWARASISRTLKMSNIIACDISSHYHIVHAI